MRNKRQKNYFNAIEMANGKKSFVLYADLLKSVDHLTEEELGKLFKHILEYVNDLNPVLEDRLLLTAWKPIERSLKEDLKKWERQLEQRRQAGKKSAESRKRKSTSVNERQRASTDSVTDTVSVNVDKQVIFNRWIDYRKEIKKPIKAESTLNNLVKKFNNKPIEEVEYVVNASIENGWQGLFWDRYTPKQTKSKSDDKMMDYIKQQINQYGNS